MTTQLRRELGVFGAIMMGLGAMLGSGVFVSIGLAAGIAGPSVLLSIVLAAGVATCNGLSSAQLATNHPVSGGTYAYGYQYLNPRMGFMAGWLFLLAKSASAATAAMGFAAYALHAWGAHTTSLVPLGVGAVTAVTLIVVGGVRRSHVANTAMVSVTLLMLLFFVIVGIPAIETAHFTPWFGLASDSGRPLGSLFHASALMFVAFTGYGRIATLGEEVRQPGKTIPKAIILTILITMSLYLAVAVVGIGVVGASGLQKATTNETAPLAVVADQFSVSYGGKLLTLGAITAMLGVLLNLILGLSRVVLAMGRQGDMPAAFKRLDRSGATPYRAVLATGLVIGGLVLIGDVKTTWSFSAFAVLIYYAITNLAALQLVPEQRRYPRWTAWVGLTGCLFLVFWVEWKTWLAGLAVICVGLLWHGAAKWCTTRATSSCFSHRE